MALKVTPEDNLKESKKEILVFLRQIGVDSRFVSVMDDKIFINNLRFSKFSRRREELFYKKFPQIKIIRSTIFQKICSRASKVLSTSLRPREKILISTSLKPEPWTQQVILEPYSRKYGIKIYKSDFRYLEDLDALGEVDFDAVALSTCLDEEVVNVLQHIFQGERIFLISSQLEYKKKKIIYPLINVPAQWIYTWLNREYEKNEKSPTQEFLLFLDKLVPDLRENILKSAQYIQKYGRPKP